MNIVSIKSVLSLKIYWLIRNYLKLIPATITIGFLLLKRSERIPNIMELQRKKILVGKYMLIHEHVWRLIVSFFYLFLVF